MILLYACLCFIILPSTSASLHCRFSIQRATSDLLQIQNTQYLKMIDWSADHICKHPQNKMWTKPLQSARRRLFVFNFYSLLK
ncbi:hypothetical protein QVD17_31542 [Tagetes erecta]|uniref:Secreted protein n=1 Tax=Tagetes erecta TaxID=13708 RepID=A0AAD8NPA7_TARER|nr:hypothetical protein QVD17_31542 [Tagetes erecta]